MRAIEVSQLKERFDEVLRVVQEGEIIEIIDGGEIVARLVPAWKKAPVKQDEAIWTDFERLTSEISAYWPCGVSASEAMRDVTFEPGEEQLP
jgi:antitoxin (DNA-binding transcriptional repressor) of toxin-antitoxin stability system